jgi:hypothetical protein
MTARRAILSRRGAEFREGHRAGVVAANDAKWRAYCEASPEPAIGMTEDDVSRSRWGHASHINTTETAAGETAQWVYDDGPYCHGAGASKRGYLYFRNGRVVAIQRQHNEEEQD